MSSLVFFLIIISISAILSEAVSMEPSLDGNGQALIGDYFKFDHGSTSRPGEIQRHRRRLVVGMPNLLYLKYTVKSLIEFHRALIFKRFGRMKIY
jgi:hypothetical protein